MIDAMIFFNSYFKYVYIPTIFFLLYILVLFFLEFKKIYPNLKLLFNDISDTNYKTKRLTDTKNNIKKSFKRNIPMMVGFLSIISIIKIIKISYQNKEDNNGLLPSIIKEYQKEKNKIKKTSKALKTIKNIKPIINNLKKFAH